VSRECAKLGIPPDVTGEAELAVNELISNAVQHGLGPYELRLYADPPAWGVVDCAGGIAVVRTYLDKAGQEPTMAELAEEHGRGLRIVGSLFSCDVYATIDACGRRAKEVTFTLPEICRDPRQP
jgi:anti-sigma regulatory factor (Ser/Thr protein kinase)